MQAGDVKIPPRFVDMTYSRTSICFFDWSLDCPFSVYAQPLYAQSAAFRCLL